MTTLKFPSAYIISQKGTCFQAIKKGQHTPMPPFRKVKWKGKQFTIRKLSYHLNYSKTEPGNIRMMCGHEWCIHPLHMYTGSAPWHRVQSWFDAMGVPPPSLKKKVD